MPVALGAPLGGLLGGVLALYRQESPSGHNAWMITTSAATRFLKLPIEISRRGATRPREPGYS